MNNIILNFSIKILVVQTNNLIMNKFVQLSFSNNAFIVSSELLKLKNMKQSTN